MSRWSNKELDSINNIRFAIAILNERRTSTTNVYSPLNQKINAAVNALDLMEKNARIQYGGYVKDRATGRYERMSISITDEAAREVQEKARAAAFDANELHGTDYDTDDVIVKRRMVYTYVGEWED